MKPPLIGRVALTSSTISHIGILGAIDTTGMPSVLRVLFFAPYRLSYAVLLGKEQGTLP